MINYSIGVTTYSYRYNKFLINLMSEIRKDNQNEIILAVNGNYKEIFDENYRKNILELSAKYNKVFPFIYPNFRSLAKMWNNIVINASNEYSLILNDDTTISSVFWKAVENCIEKYQTSFMMNGNFCQFVVKRSELNELGWFDERYLGIGWEDTEFIVRYEKQFKKKFMNVPNISGIKTYIDRENIIVNQRVTSKYSLFNQEVFNKHLVSFSQYPYEKFYWENYNKL